MPSSCMLRVLCCLSANQLGSLNSATGFSPAPTPFKEGAQMLPGLNVDVVVKMAPNSGIPSVLPYHVLLVKCSVNSL